MNPNSFKQTKISEKNPDLHEGLVEIHLKLRIKTFDKWTSNIGLRSVFEIPEGVFNQGDIDAINDELREIFPPGIVQIPKELARKLKTPISAVDTYKLFLTIELVKGGDLNNFDETKGDFAIVLSGAKAAAFKVQAWADPENEDDLYDDEKVRAPLAFLGKEGGQSVNTITLNPFVFSPVHPSITRQGPDGYLVQCVNQWQRVYADGISIQDASDASVIAHELSHFIYRASENGDGGKHGNGGINEFEKNKIRFSNENRKAFIIRYLQELPR